MIKRTCHYLAQVAFFVGVIGTTVPAFATGSVTLNWNPSTSSDVTGYYVYYGLTSGIYNYEISAGSNTTVTISNLVEGATYYFAATSHDGGESLFSNEASYTVPLNPTNVPATLTLPAYLNGQFNFVVSGINNNLYVVEASSDLVHWTPVMTNSVPFTFTNAASQSDHQFFRAVLFNVTTNEAPPPMAKINSPTRLLGEFTFTVQGVSDQRYVVQSSADLIHWTPVATNTAPFTFTVGNLNQFNQQFYRAVLSN
jgi:Fibronectin type III domain